ncbi:MAG: hypothetical protein HQL51_04430 [Magnetococcales bacterium]|nr:hypothetical protein [Magnetococcales bacterium]
MTFSLAPLRSPPSFAALLALLAACASPPPPALEDPANCAALYQGLDRAVEKAGVRDAQAAPVNGFPELRTDRFLASFAAEPLEGERLTAWVERMRQLDHEGRRVEVANLPVGVRKSLAPEGDLAQRLDACNAQWRNSAGENAARAAAAGVRQAVEVSDEYRGWQRAAGLYWLSAWGVKMGVEKYHDEVNAVYAKPLEKLPVTGKLVRYRPPGEPQPAPGEIRDILERSRRNPLAIPDPQGADRDKLFAAFAPIWEIDAKQEADQIGVPVWQKQLPVPAIFVNQPTVYRLTAHTRHRDESLLQLIYLVWFPSRPAAASTDLLAGELDGLMWRVTLDREGKPLFYDSAHNCGCYHLFFPTAGLTVRPGGVLEEPPFAPQVAPELAPGERPVLRVSHTAHSLDRVSARPFGPAIEKSVAWRDYDALRSLPLPDGKSRKSMFGPDGIVPGTQRGERFVLWPMGVPAPGEMRQWGHHATAFFGRRHFDDPNLLERSFQSTPEPPR